MSAPLAYTLLAGAISVMTPQPDQEIWEWAEANVKLTVRVSPYPGPIRFHRSPYMIGPRSPLWAYRRVQELILIWPTQVGKTIQLQIIMAWCIECAPGPGMVVYPDKEVCERRSKKHLRPLIEDCLPHQLTGRADDLTKFQFMLRSCTYLMAWSGSPSVLAAESIKYLNLDEIAKHAGSRKQDADSVSLARRRTGAFGQFSRIYACTTPLTADKPGWTEFEKSSQDRFHVRCHACKEPQIMFFGPIDWKVFNPDNTETGEPGTPCPPRGGVKWAAHSGSTKEDTAASAYYECQHCGTHWNDTQVNDAVAGATAESIADEASGVPRVTGWIPTYPDRARYGSHIVSWAASWNRLCEVVLRWLESYADPNKRRDFVNNDLACPYIETLPGLDDESIRAHVLPGQQQGIVPDGTVALILTTDIMDSHYRYRVRAWAADNTSWGIEEGQCLPDYGTLDALMAKVYLDRHGRHWTIRWAIIDSGYDTKKVYTFCARYPGRAYPIKGSQAIKDMIHLSQQIAPADPAMGLSVPTAVQLVVYHQDRWRDGMLQRLRVTQDSPGAWHLEEGISAGFCHQMRGDVKRRVAIKDSRAYKEEWVTVHANHAWDCEVYQLVAAFVFQVHALKPANDPAPAAPQPMFNPYTGEQINPQTGETL